MEYYSSGEMGGVIQQWRRSVEYYSNGGDGWSTTVMEEMGRALR